MKFKKAGVLAMAAVMAAVGCAGMVLAEENGAVSEESVVLEEEPAAVTEESCSGRT